MQDLQTYLDRSSSLHDHLCPRQVLGVRTGLLAGQLLGLDLPRSDKRLFAFVETDGCYADGISVVTNCWLGRRTLRLVDYGKAAATFVDTHTDRAVRISPHPHARSLAALYAPAAPDRWHAHLAAYQVMPDEDLLFAEPVTLTLSLQQIISKPGLRVSCECCGEEIMNAREVQVPNGLLCRHCAGLDRYYEKGPGDTGG